MEGLSVEAQGFDDYYVRLDEKVAGVVNFRRDAGAYGAVLRANTKEQIDGQGARTGGYEPLSEDYAKRKAKRYGAGRPIERASDRLYRSLVEGGEGSILEASDEELDYGTSVSYALWQQLGTARMSARALIAVTPELGRKISEVALETGRQYIGLS